MHSVSCPAVRRAALGGLAAFLTLVPAVQAQQARVYAANSANARVLRVQFDPPSTFTAIDASNMLTEIRDIAIREEDVGGLDLLATDRNGGRIAFFGGATGPGQIVFDAGSMIGPERPDGLSLDLAGNIFVMNSGQGSSAGLSEVWVLRRDADCPGDSGCLPGGYAGPLGLIDPDVMVSTYVDGQSVAFEADLLPESVVVQATAGMFEAGDLLVLTHPAAIIRYRAADLDGFMAALAMGQQPAPLTPETVIHPGGASVPLDRQFPGGEDVGGMAFGPGGQLLVVASSGRVMLFDADGRRRSDGMGGFTDFAAGNGGSDEYKVAVGLQNAMVRVFVTRQAQGTVLRYSFNDDGTGSLDSAVDGFQKPVGVDVSNGNAVSAPEGYDVIVEPTEVMSTRLEQVLQSGLVSGRVSVFPDPREAEESIPSDQPLHRTLLLSELRADFPPIEIPAWARAFRLGDPATGTPSFIVIEADNSALVSGLFDHYAIEEPILGYDIDCDDPDLTQQPHLFWAPDENDAPIVEGDVFIDVTTGCGTIRGLTWSTSYFLAGVRITESLPVLLSQKLTGLEETITASPCIRKQLSRKLLNEMSQAQRAFQRERYDDVIASLQQFETLVVQSPDDFSQCGENVAGELRARARSAEFVAGKL